MSWERKLARRHSDLAASSVKAPSGNLPQITRMNPNRGGKNEHGCGQGSRSIVVGRWLGSDSCSYSRPFAGTALQLRNAPMVRLLCAEKSHHEQGSGYLILGGKPWFIIKETQTGKTSDWLERGDSFADCTVTDFDLGDESLTIVRGSETMRLPIRQARVREGAPARAEAQILVTERGEALFRLIVGEDGRPLLNGQPFLFKAWDDMCADFARRGADVLVRISFPTGKRPIGFSGWITRITNGARGANLKTIKVVFDR